MKAASSETSGAPQVVDGERKTINSELWHACAGPLVSLPPVGSLVYYFPQGHVEQVAASTQKVADTHIPNYPNLPSQLLCQLLNVTLHADLETDEVYAQMTLQPVTSYNKDALVASDLGLKQSRQPTEFFCKTLTASDTSTHGGFSVPRRAAEKVFPALDYSAQPPAQELVARDLHDKAWTFRHIYRGQPKRHLLTTGWSVFVSSKRLVAGDSVLFIRDEKSQLLLGIRRANRQQTSMPLSVLSTDSMHIGVLAAAAHAAANQSPFIVFYNPRTSPSEFVVPLAKYNKAFYGTQVSIGMRFRMMFETEESSVRRYMGTITGISDLDPVRWPTSQWRNLQVGWDESGAGDKQNRVSIWEIETVATPFFICPPFFRLKRPLLPGILGEDSEIEAASKRSFPWLREENDVLDFQTPLPGAGLDAWMGLQQRNGVMNPNSAGDLYRSMAGGAALQELGRNNDMPKELCTSQPMLQSRDLQNSVAPLQDHLQSQILLQQMQQQIQNPQQQLTPQQVPLQQLQLQQSLLPGQLQQPVQQQQNQILQKLQQQLPPNSPQQKLQQQLQQNSLQPKLQKPVQSNVQVQQLEQQLHQQLHQQAHQNLSQMQQQQLLLQTLFNQQVSTQQLDQAPPNLKVPQNQQLQELQKSHNKEVFQKLFQHAIPGSAQQRLLMQSHQQMQLPKQPTLTSQPLDNHLLPQQIQPDQPGQNQQIVQQQLPSNHRVQNQQVMHNAALQQLSQKGSEHSSFTHQQTQLQTTPQIREADGQLLQTISSRSPSESHILHSLSARSHSEGQLLQTLSARSHSGLLASVKSQPELSETDISFCSTTTSTNAGPLPSILTKPQLCNVSMEDKSLRVPRTGTLNTDGLSHIADHISQQPVNSLLSSNKEVNHGEMKALTSLLSSEIERQSMSSGIPAIQSTAVQQPLPPASNAFWYGNGSYDNDFHADPRNNVLFGVNIENNLADVSATSTLVSRDFNIVKDAPCQLSAESIVSTLSTTKDVQPQLSSASILSSHSLGVQDLPDNSDVASTVEDNHFLQRAPTYQQPAPPMRTFTKVYKLGNVGRSIDVTRYKNYGELRHELARMFGLEGQLEDPKKTGWQLVYVDHENDILLVGDDPWEEFVSCVRYIKILSPQEVLQMSQEGMDIVNNADDNNIWRETHF